MSGSARAEAVSRRDRGGLSTASCFYSMDAVMGRPQDSGGHHIGDDGPGQGRIAGTCPFGVQVAEQEMPVDRCSW